MTDRLIKIRFIGEGISTVAGQVTALGKSVGASAAKMTSAEKDAVKFRRGLDTVGRSAGKVGLVAAAGLGAIVAATANFDQAMSNVAAATHESSANMELLRKAAIKAGADTVFSASEAAGAVENLAKAGVSTKDILGGGLSGALSLAAAGGLDVADAAEIAATALTQFKLSGRDVPHVADLLAAAAGKAQGDVSDLSFALKQSGLVASQMGISIEETTGTLAAFASAGLLGSDAGTSFRTMLLRLANPSGQAAKLMDRLGIAAYDAQGNFVGVAALSDQLQEAFKGQTQATRDAALATIFGSDAIRAANVLYDQGARGIQDWTRKVNDSGYAADTAARRMDNLKGDLEQLRGSLETAFIGAGEGSQAPLRKLVQGLTDAVNAFNKLPAAAQGATTGLLAITAITGGGLWFTAKTIKGISDMRQALDELGPSAGKAAGALRAISTVGASVAILYSIAEASDTLNQSLDRTIPGVNTLTKHLLDLNSARGVQALVSDIGDLREALDEVKDPGFFADINNLYGKVPVLGKLGQLGVSLLPGGERSKRDLREASAAIDALDEALANIVQTGSADQARTTFAQLATTFGLTKDQQEDLLRLLPQYKEALDGSSVSATLAADATGKLGSAMQQSAADAEAQAEALKKQREAAAETASAFVGLGDSLNDSKVSLNDWIKDMAKQATALRDFTKNAQTAAKRGLKEGLIAELEKAGPEGALRMKQLADGTKAQIREANRAWKAGQDAINHYVDVVGGVPPTVATELELRTSAAEAALRRIRREMADIPRRLQTDYYVIQHNAAVKPRVLPGSAGQADGGTIPGARWPYGDKVLTPTAPGEEVISNRHGQADKWRPLLKAINAGLADGGTVGRVSAGALSPIVSRVQVDPADRLLGYRDARSAIAEGVRAALSEMPVVRTDRDLSLLYGVG